MPGFIFIQKVKGSFKCKLLSKIILALLGIPKEMTFCSTLNDRLSSFIESHLQTTDVKVININKLFAAAIA